MNLIQETLLKNPPIITIWRTAAVDFEFANYKIPKGTMVCVAPSAYAYTKNSVPSPSPLPSLTERFTRISMNSILTGSLRDEKNITRLFAPSSRSQPDVMVASGLALPTSR